MTDISNWIIVLLGQRSLIGLPANTIANSDGILMDPVYELAVQTIATNKGPASALAIRPILLLGSLTKLRLPPNQVIVPIATLDKREQTDLAQKVSAAEGYAISIRSGLAIG